MVSPPATADAVVIGAGIVGCATAYALAKAGLHAVLLDKGDIGGAVSGASLACIGTHMIARDEMELLVRACDLWRGMEAELGCDFEYSAGGQMRFIRREEDIAVARSWIALERAHGQTVELLDPAAVRTLVPALTGPIHAATWSPRDATVNPFLACRAFVEAARARGTTVLPRLPAIAIRSSGGRIAGVDTPAGAIAAPVVVNAAGPWAARVAALAGVTVPIQPRKAQCLATEALPPVIACVVGACESAGGVEAGYTQIQQAAHGQVLFNTVLAGGVRGEGAQDEDLSLDYAFMLDSVETLLWLFPGLGDVRMLRSWARYEAVTPDDRFIIGPVPGLDGFLMAAGDGGTGFNRAPIIGQLLAEWITTGRSALPLAPYALDRFATQPQAA